MEAGRVDTGVHHKRQRYGCAMQAGMACIRFIELHATGPHGNQGTHYCDVPCAATNTPHGALVLAARFASLRRFQ
jgi:hypothetical protein